MSPGSRSRRARTVKVTLTNVGTQPKAGDGAQLDAAAEGRRRGRLRQAAVPHKDSDYFPAELAGEVLAHTKLLGPRESDTVEFKAPTEPGEYPYLCTFPGHFVSGMKGVLVVQ